MSTPQIPEAAAPRGLADGGRWRIALGAIVLAALIFAVMREVDWARAAAAVGRADPLWLLLAVVLNEAVLGLTTGRWLLFLPLGARVPARDMFGIVAVMTSVANGGPVLSGQAAGIHLLATRGGIGHAGGVSVTILDQLAEGLAKLALLGVAVLLVPDLPGEGARWLTIFAAALAIALVAVVLVFAQHERIAELAEGRPGGGGTIARFVASAAAQFDAIRRPSRFGVGVALKLVQKTVEGLAIAAVAVAMGVSLPAWVVVGSLAAVNLSTLVAVTPANLGGYEAGAYLVYRTAGVDPGTAVALAVVQHVVYLLPLAGTGWLIESARMWRRVRPARTASEDGSAR